MLAPGNIGTERSNVTDLPQRFSRGASSVLLDHFFKITVFYKTGALDTNRTCDPPLRRGMLYPLSYEGIFLLF